MASAERKLDIFPHIFPVEYFERMKKIAEGNAGLAAALKRWMHIPVLWDLERRMKMMRRWPGYQQVLTLSMPAIEFLGSESETPELARLAKRASPVVGLELVAVFVLADVDRVRAVRAVERALVGQLGDER